MTGPLIVAAALVVLAAGFLALLRRRPRVEIERVVTDLPARPDQLEALEAALLGRPGAASALPIPVGATVPEAAAVIVASPEHRQAVASGEAGALVGTDTAERAIPVGTLSPDGVSIIGRRGWLFIAHGANDFVRQYRGETPLSDDGVSLWGQVLAHRAAAAAQLGVPLVCLAVPDKLAMYPGHYPQRLRAARRPIQQIMEASPGRITYPLEPLRRAARGADVSLRTDSHVTSHGAEVLTRCVLEEMGFDGHTPQVPRLTSPYLMCGDLGTKFQPKLHEVGRAPAATPGLEIVEDNASEMLPLGAHLGVRRVTHNAQAPIDGRLVIFGDSYSYIDPVVAGNLGERLASAFREVHFLWAPFCWDTGYLETHRPDAVLLQMAERFVVTVPQNDVDVRELAAETLRRKSGVVPEEITSSATSPDPATS